MFAALSNVDFWNAMASQKCSAEICVLTNPLINTRIVDIIRIERFLMHNVNVIINIIMFILNYTVINVTNYF